MRNKHIFQPARLLAYLVYFVAGGIGISILGSIFSPYQPNPLDVVGAGAAIGLVTSGIAVILGYIILYRNQRRIY